MVIIPIILFLSIFISICFYLFIIYSLRSFINNNDYTNINLLMLVIITILVFNLFLIILYILNKENTISHTIINTLLIIQVLLYLLPCIFTILARY